MERSALKCHLLDMTRPVHPGTYGSCTQPARSGATTVKIAIGKTNWTDWVTTERGHEVGRGYAGKCLVGLGEESRKTYVWNQQRLNKGQPSHKNKGWKCSSMVAYLPTLYETLGPIAVPPKKKKKRWEFGSSSSLLLWQILLDTLWESYRDGTEKTALGIEDV